jgi:hypothetical protein
VRGILVTRWRRYGKDRLYVTARDGSSVGWHDLQTGATHFEQSADGDAVRGAVDSWLKEHPTKERSARTPQLATAPTAEPTRHHPSSNTSDMWGPLRNSEALSSEKVHTRQEAFESAQNWDDLADRRAGAEARKQARGLRAMAPVSTLAARILGIHTEERAWRIGADGEEKVASQLAKLAKADGRWRYLHAIPVGTNGCDIDHIVIGPGGIYTLNSKHHPGSTIWVAGNTFLVNGQYQPYLRNSRHEAQRASRLLTRACGRTVVAIGVVVPVGADKVAIKTVPTDVHVVPGMQLVAWLRKRDEVLERHDVDVVFEAARRSTTWLPSPRGQERS